MEDDQQLAALARSRIATVLNDKWTIDRVLGIGGMATVFAATHRNQKRVAIKMLHPELSQNVDVRTRFLREGYVANTVGHRGAVSVDDDHITPDGAAFLVMELLEGETLETRRARKGGRLAPDEVLSLVDQLLDVLAAAHDKGVVHRDLKPDNLFFTQEGVLKVLDFGIARLRDGSAETAGRGATRTGSVMGTPAFMAPEQARGRWEMVDGQTDLWAVGATMFTLLSGRFVREAETVNEELALAITAPVASVATVAPALPAPVVEVVDRALAYEKAARWPDARAMQLAVRQAYHALLGGEADGAAVAGSQVPRAVIPSLVDPAAGQTPSTISKVVGGTSVSPPAAAAPAPWARVGILAAAVVAVAIGVIVMRARGAPAAAAPAETATASATAAGSAQALPSASAAPAPSADPAPSASATADPAPAATTAAPRAAKPPLKTAAAKKPAPAPEPAAPPVKKNALSRFGDFLKERANR